MALFNEILIVEDSPSASFLLKLCLREMHLSESITTAANGQEAFDYLLSLKADNRKCPEIIFLDINMPVMDGFEFMEECRKTGGLIDDTKVVIVSGSNLADDIDRAQEMGVLSYLTKPVTPGSITFALETTFNRKFT
jgi:CheY-like chemotaxis protein